MAKPIPKRKRKTPASIGFLTNLYGPVITSVGGGLKGIGVPFTFRKWNADHTVTPTPMAINGAAMSQLILLDNGH